LPADLDTYILAGNEVGLGTYTDFAAGIYSFSTPSGNISCGLLVYNYPTVLCRIGENSWPPITTPTCEANAPWFPNWAHADANGVTHGFCDPEGYFTMPGKVLPYGSTISTSSIARRSEPAFLACSLPGTGNGFAIARTMLHTYGHVKP